MQTFVNIIHSTHDKRLSKPTKMHIYLNPSLSVCKQNMHLSYLLKMVTFLYYWNFNQKIFFLVFQTFKFFLYRVIVKRLLIVIIKQPNFLWSFYKFPLYLLANKYAYLFWHTPIKLTFVYQKESFLDPSLVKKGQIRRRNKSLLRMCNGCCVYLSISISYSLDNIRPLECFILYYNFL